EDTAASQGGLPSFSVVWPSSDRSITSLHSPHAAQVRPATPAWQRDAQKRHAVRLCGASPYVQVMQPSRSALLPALNAFSCPGGRQEEQDLLPEHVPDGQAVPRPQDSLLRCRAFPLLHHDRVRQQGLPHGNASATSPAL